MPWAVSVATAVCSAWATAVCALSSAVASGDIGPALGDGREAGFDIGDFAFDPGDALGLLARGLGELVALGGEVGERAGQLAEGLFRGADHGIGLGRAGIDAGAALGAGAGFVAERLFFLGKLGQRRFGVGDERALARDVVVELREPAVELGQALAGAGLLGVERVAGDQQALQGRGGARLGFAKRRHALSCFLAALAGLALGDGGFGDGAHAQILGAVGFRHLGVGAEPAQVIERGLDLADFGRDVAVADRLPGLALERVDLAGQLVHHVLDAKQVGLGGLEPQLGLVAAGVQAGNSGGLLKDPAALLGLGLDDLADAALVNERGRARAGRGVGEQGHHVAGAHLAAVDAIHRALLALDPARDVERVVLVELRRRLVLLVVDLDRDLGGVARRPVVVAGEDHVVHLGGAHRLVRGLAHHPAQRFDEVRLAAAVRPDHAGQAGLDQEVGRLDEGFEADQPQTGEFHSNSVPSCSPKGRNSPTRSRHEAWRRKPEAPHVGAENESAARRQQQKAELIPACVVSKAEKTCENQCNTAEWGLCGCGPFGLRRKPRPKPRNAGIEAG